MSFFSTQNPGIGGLDELTLSEEITVQTIASLGTPGYYLRTNLAGTAVEWAAVSGGAGGHIIQEEGSSLTARGKLNFVGAAVTATDDAGNDATIITITGSSYTTEEAQDAVGAMIDASLVYVDATPLLTRAALTGAITASQGSNTTALGSFTKTQLDTAVSDGNILYVGDITQYTDELAQDAIGTMTVDGTLVYVDVTPSYKRAPITGDVTIADGSNSSVLATVNANVGSFTNSNITVNAKGLITAASNGSGGGTTNYFNSIKIDQSGGTSDTYGVLVGAVNSSNALYTVSASVYVTGTLVVYLNGQLQTQGSSEDFVETTPASGTFTFAVAPTTGDLITVVYQSQSTTSTTVLTTRTLQTKTTTYTTLITDSGVNGDATGASFSITTPSAATSLGLDFHYTKIDSSANTVTIDGNAAENIDGATTAVLTRQYESITLYTDGSNWFIK